MALTKISGGVINTNTSITAVGATFSGNVSVAGTLTYEDVTNIDSVGLITARSGIEFGTRPGLGASISDIGNAVFAGVVTATSYYGDGSNLTGIDATTIVNGTSNVTVAASGDITVTRGGSSVGTFQSDGLQFPDTFKAKFGTSNDLEIYHDGSQSFIHDSGTGSLVIKADEFFIQNAAGTENKGYFQSDGPVRLYYDSVQKFTTTSGGIDVSGTAECDALLVADSNAVITLKDTDDSGANAPVAYIQGQDSNGSRRWFVGDLGNSNPDVYLSNDQSGGDLIFRTEASERAYFTAADGHFVPWTNNAHDLGTSSLRWRNVYTNDLNLSNEGGTNDVDGTWGSWTIQEGEDDLFLLNRRNGKKYKFNLTEVN